MVLSFHQLAKQLLEQPDCPIVIEDNESGPAFVIGIDKVYIKEAVVTGLFHANYPVVADMSSEPKDGLKRAIQLRS